jgi:hypothetical protein
MGADRQTSITGRGFARITKTSIHETRIRADLTNMAHGTRMGADSLGMDRGPGFHRPERELALIHTNALQNSPLASQNSRFFRSRVALLLWSDLGDVRQFV